MECKTQIGKEYATPLKLYVLIGLDEIISNSGFAYFNNESQEYRDEQTLTSNIKGWEEKLFCHSPQNLTHSQFYIKLRSISRANKSQI